MMTRKFFVSGLLLAALSALVLFASQTARADDCMECIGGGWWQTPLPTQPNPNPTSPPPTATPCVPEYDPPTITLTGHDPAYPIVIGQDPDQVGVDVTISIVGGEKNNGCNRGPDQRTISAVSPPEVVLSDASKDWIQNELSVYYPGAHVLDDYPLHPDFNLSGLGSATVTLTFHLDPRDPGNYDIQITARQDDGQSTTGTLQVPAYLLESTITQ